MDRRQQRLELVLLSLSNFTEVIPIYEDSGNILIGSPIVQVLCSQDSSVWVHVHDLLYFLPSPNEHEVQFIWASQDTGYRHLYLVTAQILPYMNGITEPSDLMEYVLLQPKVTSKIALTSGEWEVLSQNVWVDIERQLVYFMGLKETPLEKHLYVVSLRRPEEIRLLTRPGFTYNIEFNKVSQINFFISLFRIQIRIIDDISRLTVRIFL